MNQSQATTVQGCRVRITSHVTQSRFLHIEDSLQIGKLRLFAGTYRKGNGMGQYANAYLDIADARVLFAALARGEEGFSYKEYKGTPARAGQPTISRVLTASVKGENVYIELKTGPGKLTPTGAVTPSGPPQVEVNVAFKRHEARRLAATVLAYLQAWEVLRMMMQQQAVGLQPYTLVTAEELRSVDAGIHPERVAGAQSDQEPIRNPQSPIRNAPRPVTRKNGAGVPGAAGLGQKNGVGKRPLPAPKSAADLSHETSPTPQAALVYGDGSQVDADNQTEVQTFTLYQAEKQAAPESRTALLAFYQQRAGAATPG